MCGIAGYRTNFPLPDAVLGAMLSTMVHRGPDSDGRWLSPPFTGGMRRLSINDVAHGDQPLFNADRSVALLYNGEIYNYPALRRQLEAKGVQFRTHSDGEVICHLYDEVGEEVFEHLDGMFGAALWDAKKRRLILARDIAGEKPLYIARIAEGGIAFASDIAAIRRCPGVDLSLNYQALWDFPTFSWIPEPATVFKGVEALPRGHLLIADDDGIRTRAIANRFAGGPIDTNDRRAVVDEVRRVVTEAVRGRLLSDVPVGSFLSSGLDSSIVTTIAARDLPSLMTFSIGFDDLDDPFHGRADESIAAAAYAKQLGTKHVTIHATEDAFKNDLSVLTRYSGQPFAVSSALGILAIARAAREAGVKVLLSGDGADECFGGYSWYEHLGRVASLTALPRPDGPFSWANVGIDQETRLRVLAGYPPAERAWAWHYYASEDEKQSFFSRDAFGEAQPSLRYFAAYRTAGEWTPEDFIRQDRHFYLPQEMMRKLDLMTMATSVEGRAPYVAASVLGLAEKLRYANMVEGAVLKRSLREAFADILPDEVINRPKHGFNVPLDHWMRGRWNDLVEAAIAPSSALARNGLLAKDAAPAVRKLVADKGRVSGHTLLSLIVLNLWLETELHGNHR